jgi:hypothetical protein
LKWMAEGFISWKQFGPVRLNRPIGSSNREGGFPAAKAAFALSRNHNNSEKLVRDLLRLSDPMVHPCLSTMPGKNCPLLPITGVGCE